MREITRLFTRCVLQSWSHVSVEPWAFIALIWLFAGANWSHLLWDLKSFWLFWSTSLSLLTFIESEVISLIYWKALVHRVFIVIQSVLNEFRGAAVLGIVLKVEWLYGKTVLEFVGTSFYFHAEGTRFLDCGFQKNIGWPVVCFEERTLVSLDICLGGNHVLVLNFDLVILYLLLLFVSKEIKQAPIGSWLSYI